MAHPIKIDIATHGRFHVLDLARELSKRGFMVTLHSYVPTRRAVKFGLPAECHKSYFFLCAPLLFLQRFGPSMLKPVLARVMVYYLDWLVSLSLRHCDVFIGMSGLFVLSSKKAKSLLGAKVLVERGSTHILTQRKILAELKNAVQVKDWEISRELLSYEIADFIVIPSEHVEHSFIENGVDIAKLFRNPYGVSIDMFTSKKRDKRERLTAIMTGAWCYRKGADLITALVLKEPDVTLLHVGAIWDHEFPDGPQFVHYDAVDQAELAKFYDKADFFLLPSREEGLSLVLVQALASGLPVVCSWRSGGSDLQKLIAHSDMVVILDDYSMEAMQAAISKVRSLLAVGVPSDALGVEGRKSLTWSAYGGRYEKFLIEILGNNAGSPRSTET